MEHPYASPNFIDRQSLNLKGAPFRRNRFHPSCYIEACFHNQSRLKPRSQHAYILRLIRWNNSGFRSPIVRNNISKGWWRHCLLKNSSDFVSSSIDAGFSFLCLTHRICSRSMIVIEIRRLLFVKNSLCFLFSIVGCDYYDIQWRIRYSIGAPAMAIASALAQCAALMARITPTCVNCTKVPAWQTGW